MEGKNQENNFVDEIVAKQVKVINSLQPHCELCGGTLAGGCITVTADGIPMIVCVKCINVGIDFYIKERKRRLGE